MNFGLFRMLMMDLEGREGEIKGGKKGIISGGIVICGLGGEGFFRIWIGERSGCGKIGGIRMRKENCGSVWFLFGKMSGVGMVVGEGENGGMSGEG